ncbi:MAG: hypothetical protein ACOH5I_23870 [Oligoflexus sp.]
MPQKYMYLRLIALSGLFLLAACKSQKSLSLRALPTPTTWQAASKDLPSKFLVLPSTNGIGMESSPLKELVQQVDQSHPLFILGMGNHVGALGRTQFLNIMRYRFWWENYFFSALGSGENAAYGEGELDHGAGVQFLHRNRILSDALTQKSSVGHVHRGIHYFVDFAPTHETAPRLSTDYLLRVTVGSYRIWVWHIYSYAASSGVERKIHPNSIRWLTSSMNQVSYRGRKKSSKDLLVVMSHGHDEFWLKDLLATQEGKQIAGVTDLFLSGQGKLARRHSWNAKALGLDQAPLFLSLGQINQRAPVVLEVEILPQSESMRVAFRRIDRPANILLPAYVKNLVSGSPVKMIHSDKDWNASSQPRNISLLQDIEFTDFRKEPK